MSGGFLDYVYNRVLDAAYTIQRQAKTPLQKAFAKHLFLVSDALHDLEWVYSCDKSPGDEVESISKCLKPEDEIVCLLESAKETIKQLTEAVERLDNVRRD